MLLESNLDKKLWTEAILSAVYIVNRCPTSTLENKVPGTLWYEEKADVRKIRVFGCESFLKIPKELIKGKFDSRTIKCYLVGYCPNGYRLYLPESNKVIVGRDVIFKEDKMLQRQNIAEEADHFHIQQEEEDEDQNANNEIDTGVDNEMESITQPEEEVNQESTVLLGTRSGRNVKTPRYLQDYEVYSAYCMLISDVDVPISYTDAVKSDEWNEAIQKEINSLNDLQVWTPMTLPKDQVAVDTRWIFKRKGDGTAKARLVVKGFQVPANDDYEVFYSPVCRMPTIRIMLSLSVQYNWEVKQIDIPTAFINGKLENANIYIKIPEGLNLQDKNKILKLNRSLYGLKVAPQCWNDRFNEIMLKNNLKRSNYDFCLYYGDNIHVVLFVDDAILTGHEEEIDKLLRNLRQEFNAKDLGNVKTFLGMEIDRSENYLSISQSKIIGKILSQFNMENCRKISTPMEPGFSLEPGEILVTVPYR